MLLFPKWPASPSRQWLLAASGWILVAGTIGPWIALTPREDLLAQLVHVQFWTLELLFAALVALSIAHARSLWQLATSQAPAHSGAVWCVSASAAALLLATTVAPTTNRIYYDEQIYQNIGQNMSDLRLAQMCNDGSIEYGRLQCHEGEYNKQPYGHPYLLSIAYRAVGTADGVAQRLNSLWAALLVVVVFLTTALLFRSTVAASFAALVMALIPENLRWAATAAAEPSAAFFATFAVMSSAYFVRTRTTSALLWVVSASSFAAQFRIESALALVIVALLVLSAAPHEIRRPRTYLAAALAALLLGPFLGHVAAVGDDSWGAYGPRTSLSYVWPNLTVNGPFYLADERFPASFTLLAILGAATSRRKGIAAVVVCHFLAFFGIFLFFYAGSYDYGADVRFSLTTYPAIAILSGLGAATAAASCSTAFRLSPSRARAAVCAIIVLSFSWHLPYVRAVGEEAWGARTDVEFAHTVASTVPSDGYLFSHNPNMFHVLGTSSAQTGIAADRPGYVAGLLERYRGGVYFHWGFWCNVQDDVQRDLCRQVTEIYDLEVVAERRHWYQHYLLYRVTGVRDGDATEPAVSYPRTFRSHAPPDSLRKKDQPSPESAGDKETSSPSPPNDVGPVRRAVGRTGP